MRLIKVIKIGGSTLGSQDTTLEDLVALHQQGHSLVVVHGGGALITDWLKKQGVATRFVRGLRVTDEPALGVVVAVLAGIVNSQIVAGLNSRGGRAVGLSGVDGGLLQARIQDAELGLVGEVVQVNPQLVKTLLAAGYLPVIAPLGVISHATRGRLFSKRGVQRGEAPLTGASGVSPEPLTPSPFQGEGVGGEVAERLYSGGQILNVNADTAAAEIAAALGAERFILLTDVPGVLDKSGQVMPALTAQEAQALIESGVASGGMLPKLEACLRAVKRVPQARIIDGRRPHALLEEVSGRAEGTTISR